jgi:hypothetical protein
MPVVMSMSWRTVALPKADAASSGTYSATRREGSSCPSAAITAASVPTKDLVTDMAPCWPSGLSTPK